MRKDLDKRITPHESILLLFQEHPEVVKGIPGLAAAIVIYATATADLRSRLQKTVRTTKDLTAFKNKLKDALASLATRIATKIHLAALANNNVRMMDNIETKKTYLQKKGEEPMIARSKTLLERANQYEKELSELGVTSEELKEFSNKITEFEALSGAPTRERQSRASYMDRVEEKLTELRELFVQQIEPFVASESAKFPDFYAEFLRKKRVVQSHSTKKQEVMPSAAAETTAMASNQISTLSEQLIRSIEAVANANTSAGIAPSNGHKPGEVLQAVK
jgi:hypothetical protein